MEEIKEDKGNFNLITKKIGKMWQELPKDQKEKYQVMADCCKIHPELNAD